VRSIENSKTELPCIEPDCGPGELLADRRVECHRPGTANHVNSNDRAIVGLVMLAHAMVHTYELSVPILVSIWLSPTVFQGLSPASVGLAVTAGMTLFGLGALPAGVLADAYGSQRLIVGCLLGMGASFVVLGVAPSLPVVALALVLWGVAASVYHPSGLSLVSKGVEDRGRAFAFHGMAGNLGIALGPLVTTLLLVVFDWRLVVSILALPAGVAAIVAARVDVDEAAAVTPGASAPAEGDGGADVGTERADGGGARPTGSVASLEEFLAQSRTLFAGAFLAVFGVVILSGLYYRGVLTFLPELLSDLPMFAPVEVGGRTLEPARYVYAGLLMVGMAGQYLGGYLTDRVPTEWGIAAAFGVLTAGTLAFLPAADVGVGPLLVASATLGFFLFTVQPLYQATVAEYTPADARGLSYGYTYLGVFGVGGLGAVVAGTVLTYASEAGLFALLAVFAATASALGFVLSALRVRRRG
jgi:MFS family permease